MLGLFSRKAKSFFSEADQAAIVAAIQAAEVRTSGEVRIYVESRCRFVNPVMRARELFEDLRMDNTAEKNGVLVYLAMKDRQLAIYGDQGIHEKVGDAFWNSEVKAMLTYFDRNDYVNGIVEIIHHIGEALAYHFPYNAAIDKNELPDNMVFGH